MKPSNGPKTLLRTQFERARRLDHAEQTRELVDHLEHPQVIHAEFVEAVAAVEAAGLPSDADPQDGGPGVDPDAVVLLEHFHARREITVRDEEPFIFTCVRGRFDPMAPLCDPDAGSDDGFDYLGLIQDRERIGTLGVTQSDPSDTPYSLLMRGLAGLAEVLPDEHADRLSQRVFKGALGDQPILELHLVLWDSAARETASTLGQLTRDLADVMVASMAGQTDYLAELGSIACFTMDPENFDGELELAWRV